MREKYLEWHKPENLCSSFINLCESCAYLDLCESCAYLDLCESYAYLDSSQCGGEELLRCLRQDICQRPLYHSIWTQNALRQRHQPTPYLVDPTRIHVVRNTFYEYTHPYLNIRGQQLVQCSIRASYGMGYQRE